MAWRILACIAVGYLLGSLNGAIVVSHTCMHDDIRKKGSGNAGLTNFLRNFGGWATFLVVLIDMGKTVAAGFLGAWFLPENPELGMMIAGATVELGHIFPVFYGFRGGKGILSSAALAIIMDWRIFAIGFSLFLIVVFLTHYVSLGSILAALAYAVLFVAFFRDQPWIWATAIAMAVLAVFMHRGNIFRLLHGTETKTRLFKSKQK